LLCDIKLHQLSVSYVELKLIRDDIIWDNGVIEQTDPNIDFEIIYILKFPSNGDYNNTPVFYLRSNLGSNFFVQTHVNVTKTESETMSILNIFMSSTNGFLPNLPIAYANGDYKNDSYASKLTSYDYIELVDTNLHPIDLLYPFMLLLLGQFY
jgi:hypothetical protein